MSQFAPVHMTDTTLDEDLLNDICAEAIWYARQARDTGTPTEVGVDAITLRNMATELRRLRRRLAS